MSTAICFISKVSRKPTPLLYTWQQGVSFSDTWQQAPDHGSRLDDSTTVVWNMTCACVQPQLFIPLADVRSVEVARATGVSSTFDLYVYLIDGTAHEFTQLSRQELNG